MTHGKLVWLLINQIISSNSKTLSSSDLCMQVFMADVHFPFTYKEHLTISHPVLLIIHRPLVAGRGPRLDPAHTDASPD